MSLKLKQGRLAMGELDHTDDGFRVAAICKAEQGRCEGACFQHSGEVRAVRVSDPRTGRDWGYFAYCEEARDTDSRRGLKYTDA
jgi:hypothetical protein